MNSDLETARQSLAIMAKVAKSRRAALRGMRAAVTENWLEALIDPDQIDMLIKGEEWNEVLVGLLVRIIEAALDPDVAFEENMDAAFNEIMNDELRYGSGPTGIADINYAGHRTKRQ